MQKVAFLSRVSTLDQHSSIDNQEEVFQNWLKRNSGCILYKIYTDEGISGAKGYKRKQWLNMLEDGKQKKFDILISKSYSRFGRNQRETLDAVAMLRNNGIRIIFLEDNLDSEQDSNKFGLFAWLAEQEAQKTSERIKIVWENYNAEGKVHVTLAPYGYDYNKEIKNFVVNDIEANIVRKIFSLYIKGNGYNKISKLLTENNIPTKRNGKWAGVTICNMLKNDFYLGILTQGKTRTIDVTMDTKKKIPKEEWIKHINNHEAIISKESFEMVQCEIKKRSKITKEFYNNTNMRQSNVSLFSNLLICGECKSRLSIKRKKRLKYYKPFYNCINYELKGIKGCGHTSNFIWEDILINYIKEKLDNIVKNNYKELKNKIKQKNICNIEYEKELKCIENKIKEQINISTKLLCEYTKGNVGEMNYKLQNENIEKTLEYLENRKEELKKITNISNGIKNEEKLLIGGINDLLETKTENWNNAMIKSIIDNIVVYTDGTIEIHFKYLNNNKDNILI